MTTTAKLTNSQLTNRRLTSRRAARLATRFAAAAGAALMVFTGVGVATVATAAPAHASNASNPYAELNEYYDSYKKALNKPYSNHCWKHDKKHDDSVWCKLGKKYQDYEITNLTGPHYDSDTGHADPGPALRDIRIKTPSRFGRTEVAVYSTYTEDTDGDGKNEHHTLAERKFIVQGGEVFTVRVPIAPGNPRCSMRDISVYIKDLATGKRTGSFDGYFPGLVTHEHVDLVNPPPIKRIA